MKTGLISALFLFLFFFFYFLFSGSLKSEVPQSITVFAPSSLVSTLTFAARNYKKVQGPDNGITIYNEFSGTNLTIRKISDLGRTCDLIFTADNRLFDLLLMPDKILWYVDIFKSSMVIAYNDASSFSKEINKNNWPQILLDKNVKTGITQPQTEPAGYRALLVFKLLDKLYKNEFDKNEFDKKEYDKNTPDKNMSDKNTPDIKYQGLYNAFMNKFTKDDYRHDVSALVSALEAGFFDYIFIYKSMAVQHRLKYLDLPEKADLSSPEHADFYASEKITLKTLKTDISLTGSPIIYGASIPENASNPDDAARFLAYLIKNKNLLMQRAQLSVNTNRITDPESGLKPDLKPGLKPALKPGLKPALKSSRTYRIFKDCLLPAKEESKIFPAPEQ